MRIFSWRNEKSDVDEPNEGQNWVGSKSRDIKRRKPSKLYDNQKLV